MSDDCGKGIPVTNFEDSPLRWLPLGGSLAVGEHTISKGLFYFSPGFTPYMAHPAINYLVEVDQVRSLRVRSLQTVVSLSYGNMPDEHRRRHLKWLASERNDPGYSVNLVWNYFLGLETRAVVDAAIDPVAKSELEAIREEVRSLRSVYGAQAQLFRHQTTSLLNYLSVPVNNPTLYLESPQAGEDGAEFVSRLALSQAYRDGHPLPAQWLISWYFADNRFKKHENIAAGYRPYFEKLFEAELHLRYPGGIEAKIKADAAKKFEVCYDPAVTYMDRVVREDPAFDLFDVTHRDAGLTRALSALAKKVYGRMHAFYVRTQRPESKGKVTDAAILLRHPFWDTATRERLNRLAATVQVKGTRPVVERFSELFHPTPVPDELTRSVFVSVATELAEYFGLGLEPHPDFGEGLPMPDMPVAVFAVGKKTPRTASAEYLRRAAAVWCYALVIRASGEAFQGAIDDALRLIGTFTEVGRPGQSRLGALLFHHLARPYSLKGLQARVRAFGEDGAKNIMADLVLLGSYAGRSDVNTMRTLEKLCEAFGQPAESLYSLAHAGAPSTPARTRTRRKIVESPGAANGEPARAMSGDIFKLDADMLKQLRKETAAVGKTLEGIFVDDEPLLQTEQPVAANPAAGEGPNSLMGLDASHSSMLARLIAKSRWERHEVEAVCRELQLMTDAALERINDAAFDNFDQALLEGDDIIEINQDLVREIATK